MNIPERTKTAEGLRTAAETALSRARILREKSDFGGAIEAAQHCIELSVKSILSRCDIHYSPKHDVGSELPKVLKKLEGTSEQLKVSISRSQWIIKMWEWANSTSVYGTAETKPCELFHDADANTAISYAEDAYWTCYQLLLDLSLARVKLKGEV
jgi:HEPN domain-containing protein